MTQSNRFLWFGFFTGEFASFNRLLLLPVRWLVLATKASIKLFRSVGASSLLSSLDIFLTNRARQKGKARGKLSNKTKVRQKRK